MMKWSIAALVLLAEVGPALALDEREAAEFLAGDWVNYTGDHTWKFEVDGAWQQFNGGVETHVTYKIEAMPANLFRLISSTGSVYVAHAASTGNSFKLFANGREDIGLAMYRWSPTFSDAQPQAGE